MRTLERALLAALIGVAVLGCRVNNYGPGGGPVFNQGEGDSDGAVPRRVDTGIEYDPFNPDTMSPEERYCQCRCMKIAIEDVTSISCEFELFPYFDRVDPFDLVVLLNGEKVPRAWNVNECETRPDGWFFENGAILCEAACEALEPGDTILIGEDCWDPMYLDPV